MNYEIAVWNKMVISGFRDCLHFDDGVRKEGRASERCVYMRERLSVFCVCNAVAEQ